MASQHSIWLMKVTIAKSCYRYRTGTLSVFVLYISQLCMVDFGELNPYPLGGLSGVAITLTFLLLALIMGRYSRRIFIGYIITSSILLWAVVVTNWWYFQYFRAYYSYELLKFGLDVLDAAKAASGLLHKDKALLLLAIMASAAVLSVRYYNKSQYEGRIGLALIFALGMGAGISFWITGRSYNNYQKLGLLQLTPSFYHPVHAFFSGTPQYFPSSEGREAMGYFAALNEPAHDEVMALSVVEDTTKFNVIFVVMESVRADMVGFYGNRNKLTPNMDAMAKDLVVATNFYSNTNYTMKGEMAIWCGVVDSSVGAAISYSDAEYKGVGCLPNILKEFNYKSYYYHANKGSFYNRREFLPKLGFDYLFFEKDENVDSSEYVDIGWGIDDAYMYDRMLNDMLEHNAKSDDPFFTSLMTISSHYPFTWNWGVETPNEVSSAVKRESDMYNNYENAVFYQDLVLGRFWSAFKSSVLYDNTVVVITSDHGVWTFPNEAVLSNAEKNERFFRAPLLIYHPSIVKAHRIDQVASQIDLAPTLLSILGVENGKFLGKNIFQSVKSPWAVMIKQGETLVRVADTLCFVDDNKCSGIHQNCVSTRFFDPLIDISVNRVCENVGEDVLVGGSVKTSTRSEKVLDYAIDLLRYQEPLTPGM